MPRYLVIANRTVCGDHLLERMRDLAEQAGGEAEFDIVVPATYTGNSGSWTTEGESVRAAQLRLDDALARFASEGLRVSGAIGDANPVLSVLDACRRASYDEVIVSTLAAGPSRWLRRDLPNRIARAVDVPVTHVIAQPAPLAH